MTDWFDPQTWLRQLPDPLNVRGILLDGAAGWLDELASLARNRPVEVRRGNNRAAGTIRTVKLFPSGTPNALGSSDVGFDTLERAVVVIDDVTWAGREIDRVEVAVENVRIAHRPRSRISGGPVTLDATIPLRTLATWLAESNITVAGADPGVDHITVHYRWWRLPFVASVVPGVTARAAVFTIRDLRLYGRVVPLPKRFDLSLTVQLDVDDTVRLRDAKLVDDKIVVEAQALSIEYPISMQQIIDGLGSGADRSVLEIE